jgi:hypothetical protein
MSAASDIYTSLDPQLQSKFFALSAEIRYAIYACLISGSVHLSLRETTFRLLSCVQRFNDDPDCDSRKWYDGVPDTDSNKLDNFHRHRLQSTWGEH